jgi:ribosome-binding factor A
MAYVRYKIRKKKIEKAIAKNISEILLIKMNDQRFKNEMISIHHVEVTDDLAIASVFFNLYNLDKKNKIIKALYQAIPFLHHHLRKKITIKKIPQLKFFYNYEDREKNSEVVKLIEKLSTEYKQNK